MFTAQSRTVMPARPSTLAWPTFPDSRALDDRFQDFVSRAQYVRGLSPATLLWYRDGYRNFGRFMLESEHAGEIVFSPALIESWLAWSRARSVTPHTVKTYWTSLKCFVGAVAKEDEYANPFAVAHPPKLPIHNYKALPPSDCERLLATVLNYPWPTKYHRARNAAMLGVALYAGLRKREILRLERSDVDLVEGTIAIRRGKGLNGGKDRTAYICAELQQLVATYLYERDHQRLSSPEFFVSLRTKRGVSDQSLKRIVSLVREAAGIRFSLHVLRHSFVTMLLRSGVPIHVARDLAGHSNIHTTEGYARVFREDLRQHIESMRFRGSVHPSVDG